MKDNIMRVFFVVLLVFVLASLTAVIYNFIVYKRRKSHYALLYAFTSFIILINSILILFYAFSSVNPSIEWSCLVFSDITIPLALYLVHRAKKEKVILETRKEDGSAFFWME